MGAITHNGEVLQGLPADASQINFDKTGTDLNSTQTEAAIKEVNTKVNTNTEDITQLKSGLIGMMGGAKMASGYKSNDNPSFTIDNGTYLLVILKAQYGNCAIYCIASNRTPVLMAGKDLTVTQTESDNRITVAYGDTYSPFLLIKTNCSNNMDDEIHLTLNQA